MLRALQNRAALCALGTAVVVGLVQLAPPSTDRCGQYPQATASPLLAAMEVRLSPPNPDTSGTVAVVKVIPSVL